MLTNEPLVARVLSVVTLVAALVVALEQGGVDVPAWVGPVVTAVAAWLGTLAPRVGARAQVVPVVKAERDRADSAEFWTAAGYAAGLDADVDPSEV